MKFALLLISFVLICMGCQQQSSDTAPQEISDNPQLKNEMPASPIRDTFDCKVFGKRDKTSDSWIAEKELYFTMTNDIFQDEQPKFTSYNVFQVYNTLNCNLIYNGKLPLVEELVRPYQLQVDIYEPINQLVCTQSPENIHCFHLGRKEILIPLSPPVARSKSGTYDPNLKRDLTTWGNYLFGWTEKIGAYAFDMTNLRNPSAVITSGTFSTQNNTNYLFVLNSQDGLQLLVSEVVNGKLTMHPMLSKPLNLNRRVYRDRSGGRYAFLKSNVGTDFVAIDMLTRKIIDLPNKAMESTLSVKSYLKSLN